MNKKKQSFIVLSVMGLLLSGHAHSDVVDGPGGTIDITMGIATSSTSPEAALHTALVQMCNPLDGTLPPGSLRNICEAILANTNQAGDAYRQISARSISAISSLLSQGTLLMSMEDISSRLAALRRAARNQQSMSALDPWRGRQVPELASLLNAYGGGAGDNNSINQSYFVSVSHINSEQDETNAVAGFESNIYAATIGMDYRLSRQLFAGFASRLLSGDTELSYNGGSLSSRDTNLTYYASYFPTQNLYFDGTLQVSRGFYDLSRKIDFTVGAVTVRETTEGRTRGSQLGLTLGAGYEYYIRPMELTAQVSAKYRYNRAALEAYRESGGGAVNLDVDGQTINTQVASLGVTLNKAFSYSGGVILPQLDLVWKHDFATSGQDVSASFVSDPNGTKFIYRTDEKDSDFFELSLGLSSIRVGGMTTFFQYTSLLGYDNYEQSLFSLGVRAEF